MQSLAEAGAALVGGILRRAQPLAGGDLSQVVHITLMDGREAVVKGGPAPLTEAAMLNAIAASGAPAPAVLAASGELLVLEALAGGGSLDDAWASLGAALATLHKSTAERYGWREDYAFGPVPISNGWCDNWPEFWAERRLRVHLPHLALPLARRVEALAARLADRLPRRPPPLLLHGDLWSGNVLAAGGRISGLIDPACTYGHAEADFAMLRLFDQPGPAFYEAYGPLEAGHEERLPVYQLWPALVHLRLFGSGYRSMAERLLGRAGA